MALVDLRRKPALGRQRRRLLIAAAEQRTAERRCPSSMAGKASSTTPSRASWRGAARVRCPRDGLDQIAALGAEPAGEPKRQAVGGQPPGFLDIGALGDQGIRRPDRHVTPLERRRASAASVAPTSKPWPQPGHGPGELIHGEQRHAVRRPVAEPELALAGAHLVGESPSPRHHDDRARRCAMASSQAESSAERTTLPPSLTTMGRAAAGTRREARLGAQRAAAMVRPSLGAARSRRRPRQAPCRASRSSP